jgi:acetyl esterase/lipase
MEALGAINTLRDSGYTVISATYTLARNGKSPFPDCIEDAFDVVKWVKKNWKVYNLDTNNVGVMGESAGGHIALMLGYARNDSFPQTALPLKFVVDVYGPTDLKALSQLAILDSMDTYLANVPSTISDRLDIVRYLVGFDPTSDSTRMFEFTQLYSPIQYVNPNIPPTLIVHGEKDQVVPIEQSILLHTVLDSLGLNNHFHKVNNMDHAFFGANTQQKQEVQQLIVDFVLKHQE